MGTAVFQTSPGSLAVYEGVLRPIKLAFELEGWRSHIISAVITAVRLLRQTNHQLATTLGGSLYLYVFGDVAGIFEVEGIAADGSCQDQDRRSPGGFDNLIAYYEANKLSRRAAAMRVTIGSTSLNVYLMKMDTRYNAEAALWNFSMTFVEIPQTLQAQFVAERPPEERVLPAPVLGPIGGGTTVPLPPVVPGDPGGAPVEGIVVVPVPDGEPRGPRTDLVGS